MLTYKNAGVDTHLANQFVSYLKKKFPQIGGFGGLYPIKDQYLVASTDGVGTKLKLAFELNQHNTIGIDLVAMCINDVITTGAAPLFFLDYFATSKLGLNLAKEVIEGIVIGCSMASCTLLGGETAEMPDIYTEGEYDLAGFCVGIVDRSRLIDGKNVKASDVIVGIPSAGVHSNGYSLVRKVIEVNKVFLNAPFNESTIGLELLKPTRIYADIISKIIAKYPVKAMAHITGGGLVENISRAVPEKYLVHLEKKWEVPEIFQWIQKTGNIDEKEMYNTFNMGIGYALITDRPTFDKMKNDYPELLQIGTVHEKGAVC